MKKINFEELMASVSEQFVEEAASFSPIKAFNTRFVALAACIAIIVTAIPAVVILNREKDVDAPKVTTPVEDIVVTPGGENIDDKNVTVIYCDELTEKKQEWITHTFNDSKVEVKDATEFGNNNYLQDKNHEGEILKPDINVPKELNFTIGGTSVTAILESVYYTSNTKYVTDEALKANNKIARYKTTTVNGKHDEYMAGNDVLLYNVTSKEIIAFHTEAVPYYAEAELSENELLEIVKKDVTQLYGKDFLKKHDITIIPSYKTPTSLDKGGWRYSVGLVRKFGEFRANEYVLLKYNGYGQLQQLLAYNLNAFDNVEPKITNQSLEEAEEKALKLLDGRLVENKKLYITNNGDVYAYYNYFTREGDERYPNLTSAELYIKVNIG